MTSHKLDNLDLGFGIPDDALDYLDPEILKKWPQGLSDMLTVVENAHVRAGDDPKVARSRAFAAVSPSSRCSRTTAAPRRIPDPSAQSSSLSDLGHLPGAAISRGVGSGSGTGRSRTARQ